MKQFLRTVLCVSMVLCCGSAAGAQTTALYIDSVADSPVGQRLDRTWTTADGPFSGTAAPPSYSNKLSVNAGGWVVILGAPESQPLSAGIYEHAMLYSADFAPSPTLALHGLNRHCANGTIGRFRVYEVTVASNGEVTQLAADFELRCRGEIGAVHAALRLNSTRASLVPFEGDYPVASLQIEPSVNGHVTGAGIDCGEGRPDCEERLAPGTFVSLQATAAPGYSFLGWQGDCVGDVNARVAVTRRRFCSAIFEPLDGSSQERFRDALYLEGPLGYFDVTPPAGAVVKRVFLPGPPDSPLRSLGGPYTLWGENTPSWIWILIQGPEGSRTNLTIRAPAGETLLPGNYDISNTPGTGDFRLDHNGGGCLSGGGYLTVHEYEFDHQTRKAVRFSADFLAPCSTGLVIGSIRINASPRTLVPFGGATPARYALTVSPTSGGLVTASGIECGDGATDCEEAYASPTEVTLVATASAGYRFFGWAGACRDFGGTARVSVDRRTLCRAVFAPLPENAAAGDPELSRETLMIETNILGAPPVSKVFLGSDSYVTAGAGRSSVEFHFGPYRPAISITAPAGLPSVGEYVQETPQDRVTSISLSGCTGSAGRVRIHEISVHPTNGAVLSFSADFELRCQPGMWGTQVSGALRYRSTRARLVPFEGIYPMHRLVIDPSAAGIVTGHGASTLDCGPGRASCTHTVFGARPTYALVATPAPGYTFAGWSGTCSGQARIEPIIDWIWRCEPIFVPSIPDTAAADPRLRSAALQFDSEPGEPVGAGLRQIWLNAEVKAHEISRSLALFSVSHPDGRTWWLYFEAPSGQELRPGSYEFALDAWTANAGPGLHIRAPHGGCPSTLVGRFVIHEITFASSTSAKVSAVAADFEQRCSQLGPRVRGALRLNSTRSVITPFAAGTRQELLERARSRQSEAALPSLVWRHTATGANALWSLTGIAASTMAHITPQPYSRTDPAWHLPAAADVNGDGQTDLVWQHATTGSLAVWYMSGHEVIGTEYFLTLAGSIHESDTDWKIAAAGDVDLDGDVDLLWRHAGSGAIRLWHMDGMRQSDSVDVGVVSDPEWHVKALADMNNDGFPDIVWWHERRGAVASWLMSDTVVSLTTPASHGLSDVNWRLVGVADLDHDRQGDLVWQNGATGELGVWFMQALQRTGGRHLEPATVLDRNWRIVAVK